MRRSFPRSRAPTRASPREPPASRPETADHDGLGLDVATSVSGAAAAGFGADLMARLATGDALGGGLFSVAALTGALTGLAFRRSSARERLLGPLAGLVGSGLFALAFSWSPSLAVMALGFAAVPVLWPGPRGLRDLGLAGLAAGLSTAGLFVGRVTLSWNESSPWVPPVAAGLVGMFVGLGAAPFRLGRGAAGRRPPASPAPRMLGDPSRHGHGEVSRLMERVARALDGARAELERRPRDPWARHLMAELPRIADRLDRAGHALHDLERSLRPLGGFSARRAQAETRSTTQADPEAARTYAKIAERLRRAEATVQSLRAVREQRLAQLCDRVTQVERLHLALVHVRVASTAAEAPSSNLDLEDLELEIETTAEALRSLEPST